MPYRNVSGFDVRTFVDHPAPAARRVFAIHGFTQGPTAWREVAELSGPSIALSAVVLPGHSMSPEPNGGFEATALALSEAMVRVPADEIIGYSMGARFGLALAILWPDRVKRAILIGVHPGLESEDERTKRRRDDAAWAAILRKDGLDAFLAAWETQPLFLSQRSLSEKSRVHQHLVRTFHTAEGLAAALEAYGLAEMPSYWERLDRIRAEVVLVVGEKDAKFRALAERFCARCSRASIVIVQGVEHNVVLEAPNEIARILRAVSIRNED